MTAASFHGAEPMTPRERKLELAEILAAALVRTLARNPCLSISESREPDASPFHDAVQFAFAPPPDEETT